MKFGFEGWGGDREIGAVDVIDENGDVEKDDGKQEWAEAVLKRIFGIGHERRWRDFAGRAGRKQ
jgi:hypothetical protein